LYKAHIKRRNTSDIFDVENNAGDSQRDHNEIPLYQRKIVQSSHIHVNLADTNTGDAIPSEWPASRK